MLDLVNKIKLMYGRKCKSLFRDKASQEFPLVYFYFMFRSCAVEHVQANILVAFLEDEIRRDALAPPHSSGHFS